MHATINNKSSLSQENDHCQCLLCGTQNPYSLGLAFNKMENGVVEGAFKANQYLQGYNGILHGGVIASVLDAAITHCLFHHEIKAFTADLRIRYRHPVPCDAILTIRAWVTEIHSPLFHLKTELIFDKKVMVWAKAKFLKKRDTP